ncbi:MAG: DUF975 family protein [Gracilibacteraceae bacterium]|nr:DUF975 family protein [Gracilibacteraceae bacterium]
MGQPLSSSAIRERARELLGGQWLKSALVLFMASVFIALPVIVIDLIWHDEDMTRFAQGTVTLLVGCVFRHGLAGYFLAIARGQSPAAESVFAGLKVYPQCFVLFFYYNLFISCWTLLLAVPGIIKMHSYALTFYIRQDRPYISGEGRGTGAITASRQMMDGSKARLFFLYLSFAGWAALLFVWVYLLSFASALLHKFLLLPDAAVQIVSIALLLLPLYCLAAYIETSAAVFYESLRTRRTAPE